MDERFSIYQQDLTNNPRQFKSLAEVPTSRLIWQPRLTKPKAQENSMLFKAYPGSDNIKVIWMIPDSALWDEYTKGKMLENKTVSESIHLFKTDKKRLEMKENDDLSDEMIDKIYRELSWEARKGRAI